jgi:hypothetical protein
MNHSTKNYLPIEQRDRVQIIERNVEIMLQKNRRRMSTKIRLNKVARIVRRLNLDVSTDVDCRAKHALEQNGINSR